MVLNANPRISDKTAVKVRRVIEQLGYRPNSSAQSLAGRYTGTVAVLLPALRHTLADAYFGEVLSGICDKAGKLNQKVLIEQAKPEWIKDGRHLELFDRRFIDGMLCVGFSDRHHFLSHLSGGSRPVLVVNNYFPSLALDYVVCDYRAGTDQALSYLLQLGHVKIGLIGGAPEVQTARDIRETYLSRLRRAGLNADEGWTEDGRYTEAGGAAAAEKLRWRHPDMTAIFAGNDKMAVGAIHRLSRLGVQVPSEVSIVGCDNLPQSSLVLPSLTTIHTPLYEVGSLACERLVEKVRGKVDQVRDMLATHLVFRESTALAPTIAATQQAGGA